MEYTNRISAVIYNFVENTWNTKAYNFIVDRVDYEYYEATTAIGPVFLKKLDVMPADTNATVTAYPLNIARRHYMKIQIPDYDTRAKAREIMAMQEFIRDQLLKVDNLRPWYINYKLNYSQIEIKLLKVIINLMVGSNYDHKCGDTEYYKYNCFTYHSRKDCECAIISKYLDQYKIDDRDVSQLQLLGFNTFTAMEIEHGRLMESDYISDILFDAPNISYDCDYNRDIVRYNFSQIKINPYKLPIWENINILREIDNMVKYNQKPILRYGEVEIQPKDEPIDSDEEKQEEKIDALAKALMEAAINR